MKTVFSELILPCCHQQKKKHRYNEINPDIDKKACGYQHHKEAVTKSTMHLEQTAKRAIEVGIRLPWDKKPSALQKSGQIKVL